jgi:hypothetical protein
VFTPDSFLELYERLARLGLIEFEIVYFAPTEFNTLEFYVSLRRMGSSLDRESMIERQVASANRARMSIHDGASQPDPPQPEITMGISPMEYKLIATKRRVLAHVRDAIGRRRFGPAIAPDPGPDWSLACDRRSDRPRRAGSRWQ